ncbi:anti-repressor SinI family protein [Bacillus sp. SA1-12]|nr:anti-repressor SinI family protein [Bacillus sp. SA1-12]
MVISPIKENSLDEEWVDLILYARELGISVEEIREFFNKHSLT